MIGKPEIVSEDSRGWIARILLPDGRECIIIYTRKGYARGGEYHKSIQHDVVILGSLKWKGKKTPQDPVEDCGIQAAGTEGTWAAYQVHMAEALEDTLYIEYLEGDFEKTFDPETRKTVEARMNENPSGSS